MHSKWALSIDQYAGFLTNWFLIEWTLFIVTFWDLVNFLGGCKKNPCRDGGTCEDLGDEKYDCKCTKDYQGDHYEIGVFVGLSYYNESIIVCYL